MIEIFTEELYDVERSLEVLEQSTMRYRSRKMQKGLEVRQENLKAKLSELRKNWTTARMIPWTFIQWV